MTIIDIVTTSLAFALFIVCPRMAGMCAVISKIHQVNPYIISITGTILSTPLVVLLLYITINYGITLAIIFAAITDIIASLIIGTLNIKYAIEILIISTFVWAGVYTATKTSPIITKILQNILNKKTS
ncbi:MAG: hypothetical protein GXO26_10080 [Crenarchaeota archaeon]|nr:hypothetical protein [Thermoproteota archaeon]